MHGLYHERRNGGFDDFHTVSKATATEEIRAGMEIFYKLNRVLKYLFVPPSWKLNENSIEVLKKMGYNLTEIQERLLLLSYNYLQKDKGP